MAKKTAATAVTADKPKDAWADFKANPASMEAIAEHVVSGESLRSFCIAHGFSPVSMLTWIEADPVRSEHYTYARAMRAELVFDEIDEVSEQARNAETAVQVAGLRLKADNMKWKLARMSPKKYGEKIQTEHTGEIALAGVSDEELDRRIAERMAAKA